MRCPKICITKENRGTTMTELEKMELIDKSALVAKIEKLQKVYSTLPTRNDYEDCLKEGRLIGYKDALNKINSIETKEVDLEKEEEKLNKAIKLADAMYNAAQQLTTDASRLHKAMQDWWNFKNIEL